MLDPIVKTIEVPCNQKMAFGVFVNEMHTWWPLTQRSMSAKNGITAKTIEVEARVGGKIVEVSDDDTEHLWGTILTYEPFAHLGMSFHMGLPPVDPPSMVDVRFTSLSDEETRVELTQSNWEAYGELAEMMYGGYGSGWGIIFEEAYKAACGGAVVEVKHDSCYVEPTPS